MEIDAVQKLSELLNEEKWTRATLNNYTIKNFTDLDDIIEAAKGTGTLPEVRNLCSEHLKHTPNSIIALYVMGKINFEEEVLEPFQLNIVHQISRALQFFASSNDYTNIGTIYLSGGVASLKGLAAMVQQELGMTTRVADPVTGLDIADHVAVTALKRNATNLMIAMGLALRGFD